MQDRTDPGAKNRVRSHKVCVRSETAAANSANGGNSAVAAIPNMRNAKLSRRRVSPVVQITFGAIPEYGTTPLVTFDAK